MAHRRVILLLADGTRPDVLGELIAAGELPNILAAFPEPAMRRTATTVFPSTTGPAFLPFTTGCFPGTMNMPGIRWFDRAAWAQRRRLGWTGRPAFRSYVGIETYRMSSDLSTQHKTLFELVPRSVSIFNRVNRGVSRGGDLAFLSHAWWWWFAHETNRWDLVNGRARQHLVRALDRDPEFVFCLIPDVDNYSHHTHMRSEKVLAAYHRLDGIVGELFAQLDRRGWRDETLVMIVSDHGHATVNAHLGLPEWLRDELGMNPFYYPRIWKRRFDSAAMVSGNGMAHVHVRQGKTWTPEPARDEYLTARHPDLLEALLARPEIDIVATRREDGTIIVRSRRGESGITQLADGKLEYRANGGDAFGYVGIGGVCHPDDMLALTQGTRYPDAPVQLAQLFRSPRTGDIVVSAELGYDLRDKHERPEHKSGHGAIHADHMVVPWFSTAPLPGVCLRTVDTFPFVLRWLGREIPEGIDGRDVFSRVTQPVQSES